MMTCREFADFIADYLGDELPDTQLAVFERHMAMCPDCTNYLESYRQTVALEKRLFGHPDHAVPVEVPEDLIAAILDARGR